VLFTGHHSVSLAFREVRGIRAAVALVSGHSRHVLGGDQNIKKRGGGRKKEGRGSVLRWGRCEEKEKGLGGIRGGGGRVM